MVQKSGEHQLWLVVYPIIYGFKNARWLCGISEPSTVVHGLFQPYISRLGMSRKWVKYGEIIQLTNKLLTSMGHPSSFPFSLPGMSD